MAKAYRWIAFDAAAVGISAQSIAASAASTANILDLSQCDSYMIEVNVTTAASAGTFSIGIAEFDLGETAIGGTTNLTTGISATATGKTAVSVGPATVGSSGGTAAAAAILNLAIAPMKLKVVITNSGATGGTVVSAKLWARQRLS